MMLTNLADILRNAGLSVVEVAGWRTRGHGQMSGVRGVLWHHTATSAKASGDYPSLAVVRDGRSDLTGPLCNLGLGRNGTWYVVAAGLAYHAGVGSYPGVGSNGNGTLIGVEAEHPGTAGTPWPAAQIDSYRRGTAALLKAFGLGADRCIGHKEWAPSRKIDPYGLDMNAERRFVANYMNPPVEDDVRFEDTFKNKTNGQMIRLDDALGFIDKNTYETSQRLDALEAKLDKAVYELTYRHPNRVDGKTADTMLGYTVNSDKYGFENAQRLDRVERQLADILTVLKAKG